MGYIKREIQKKIRPWLLEPQIILIKGARRAGKTTLLYLLSQELERDGHRVVYYAVDQMLHEPFWKSHNLFYAFLRAEHTLSRENPLYVMLDEIQYLPDPGIFLKTLYDAHNEEIKLTVTGSSALELSKTKEFLSGRKVEFELERFSFRELWRIRQGKGLQDQSGRISGWEELSTFYEVYKERLEEAFLEYITWGGYPEVVLQENHDKKALILRNILNTYLEKDVAALFHLGNISGFNNLIQILARHVGKLLNKKEISSTLGMHFHTLVTYLDLLSGTFIFDLVRPFYKNVRKELTKMPKIYARDFGIIQCMNRYHVSDFALVDGPLVENFVYRHLIEDYPKDDILFYRTRGGAEIDFIIRNGTRLKPVEVKFRRGKLKVPRAIRTFISTYSHDVKQAFVVTQDYLARTHEALFIPAPLFPFVEIRG